MHLSLMPLFNTFTQLSSWAFVSVLEDHGSALPAWTWHLRIWWNSRFLFPDPFRFGARMNVSFKARVTIHQSIPQPSRPSSPGKMSPGGCDDGGACSTGIYACATCAHDDASGSCGSCGADPISRVTWKDDGKLLWVGRFFASHNLVYSYEFFRVMKDWFITVLGVKVCETPSLAQVYLSKQKE